MDPHISSLPAPALSVAIALVAGVFAQAIARHLRIPGIVLLLAVGHILGPDVLGFVRPESLGGALQALVGFAVAVVLFEGGLNLDLKRLRREARAIRQLVTVGALVTAAGGAVAARLILDWTWTLSVLFGTLVIVTGPTVITPLLRRIRLQRGVSTVLEAEGVLIDAVGAVTAVVTLEVLISPFGETFSSGLIALASRLGLGAAAGAAVGWLIARLLRHEGIVPEGLANIVTLSCVLALFQISNHLQPESGIVAVTAAGIAMGNLGLEQVADLKDFKEQLTVLLIGMLFVLLAADVRVAEALSLGWPGVWTVAVLMLVVRPLNVLVGTAGSTLGWRERAFIAWLAPRGIVAAAVASLFAQRLDAVGVEGGGALRALVFSVIAATVLIQGLSGGLVARLLGVWRPSSQGWVILGANPVGLAMGDAFRDAGQEVVFMDSNPSAIRSAESRGFRSLYGNALSERMLQRAEMDSRAACIAMTPNEEVNYMLVRWAREEFKVPRAWLALRTGGAAAETTRVTDKMLHKVGARVLFGRPRSLDKWISRIEREEAVVELWELAGSPAPAIEEPAEVVRDPDRVLLPLAVQRGTSITPFEGAPLRDGDLLHVLVAEEKRETAEEWLEAHGFRPASRAAEGTAPEPGAEPVVPQI